MSTVMIYLLLALSSALGVTPTKPMTLSADTQLEDVLKKGAWVHNVRLGGRITIESRFLTFCDEGRVYERIWDDTGRHDSSGDWSLEKSADGDVLVLSGTQLLDHGRFFVTYAEKEKAIDLRYVQGGTTLRFESVRADTPSPCAESN